MTSQASGRDPLEQLAEEFAERYRRGERPSIEEYAARHPDLAEQIRELFPTLAAVEEFGPVGGKTTGPYLPYAPSGLALPRLGEYRILREVGRGGMGVVYEAMQESLGRHVALKVLPFHGSTNPVYRERFRREAQAAAKLHHTNIVPVFGVGEHDGVHYYAMQFIQGQGLDAVLQEVIRLQEKTESAASEAPAPTVSTRSLAQNLLTGSYTGPAPVPDATAASPPLPPIANEAPPSAAAPAPTEVQYPRQIARMGLQVAEALAYAHHHGILHRDIKPSNLLLDGEGIVWITDFGLAKAEGSEELTGAGDIVGTLRYMAPERFRGISDARGDVYGLGVTLFEMLTRRPAFEDDDRVRLIDQVLNAHPPRLRQLDAHIPRDLETIILKAMAKEAADRYPTAAAFAEDLRRFLEDRPIQARRTSLLERVWRWRRRNPALAAVAGLAMFALLAIVVLSLGLAIQQSNAAADIAKEQQRTLAALKTMERMSADLEVDKSLTLCEKGDVEPGMLRLADCLGLTMRAGTSDLERGVRANLAAWRREINPLRMLVAHKEAITAVAFSPDGRTLLTGSRDGTARRWDAATGSAIGDPLRQLGTVRAVAWSPDGATIATVGGDGMGGQVWLWDAADGRRLSEQPLLHTREVRAVAFSPDSRTLVTGSIDQTAQLWDVRTQRPLFAQSLRHDGQIEAVAFSPDGTTILTGSLDGTARLWDAKSGAPRFQLVGHKGEVWAVAFSPDGKTIATGSLDETARLWKAETGEAIGNPLPQHAGVIAVDFSADSATLLTAGGSGRVLFWRTDTGHPVGRPLQHPCGLRAAVFRPGGKGGPAVLTGCEDGVARLWDVSLGGPTVVALEGAPNAYSAAFRADTEALVTGGNDAARLWATATGRPLVAKPLPHPGEIDVVAFSPDGRLVLTGGTDTAVRLWRAADGAPAGAPLPHKGEVWAGIFTPDGRRLITSDSSASVSFWDLDNSKLPPAVLPSKGVVQTLAVSPDGGTLLTGTRGGSVRLWRADTGEPSGRPLTCPRGCWSAAYSPDGGTFVTGSGAGVAQQWEVATEKPRGPGLEQGEMLRATVFGPGGDALLTGSADGTARLWQTATGKGLGPPMRFAGPVLSVAFTPDGATVRATDGQVVYSVPVPAPIEDAPERITAWVQVMTGMELDADGAIRPLDAAAWSERRRNLDVLGGPPLP